MEGLHEAISLIQDTAVTAAGAQEFHRGRRAVRYAMNGGQVEVLLDAPARTPTATTLQSLAEQTTEHSAIWHDGDTVVAVIDDRDGSHRDDRATLTLARSDKWLAVKEAATPRDQQKFLQYVNLRLRDELQESSPSLLPSIRSVKFRSLDEQVGDVQLGKESMGRQIDREIAGADKLPAEDFGVRVPRWLGLDIYVTVRVVLEVDLLNRTFALAPMADELANAEIAAQVMLHEKLTDMAQGAVYYGRP